MSDTPSTPTPTPTSTPTSAAGSEPLTHLEGRVLAAVTAHLQAHGESPTIAELAARLRLKSRGTVHRYVQALIRKGELERVGHGWRGLRLPGQPTGSAQQNGASSVGAPDGGQDSSIEPRIISAPALVEGNVVDYRPLAVEHTHGDFIIPLLGRIAAGQPIEAIEDQNSLDLAAFFIGPDRYALRVTGDSMVDAGILDGDTVVLRKQHTAHPGDIVVALIDGQEATLKRLGDVHDGLVELIPENSSMKTMQYATTRVSFQGVLVGQLRSY